MREFEEYGKRFYGILGGLRNLLLLNVILAIVTAIPESLGLLGFGSEVCAIVITVLLCKILSFAGDRVTDEFHFLAKISTVTAVSAIADAVYVVGGEILFPKDILIMVIGLLIKLCNLIGVVLILTMLPRTIGKVFESIDESIAASWKKCGAVIIPTIVLEVILVIALFALDSENASVVMTTVVVIMVVVVLIVALAIMLFAIKLLGKSQKMIMSKLPDCATAVDNNKAFAVAFSIAVITLALIAGVRIYCSTIPAQKTLEDVWAGNIYTIPSDKEIGVWDYVGMLATGRHKIVKSLDEIKDCMDKKATDETFALKVNRANMKPVGNAMYQNLTWTGFWDYYEDLYGKGLLLDNTWKLQDYEITLSDGEIVYGTYAAAVVEKMGDGEIVLPVSSAYYLPSEGEGELGWSEFNRYNHMSDPSMRDLTKLHISGNFNDKFNFQNRVEECDRIYRYAAFLLVLVASVSVWKTVKIKSADGDFEY